MKNTKTKYASIAIIMVVLLVLFLEKTGRTDFISLPSKNSDTVSQGEIVQYSPPTEDEQDAGDIKKSEIVENSSVNNPPDITHSSQQEVSVIIVDAKQYGSVIEVRAYASNITENGKCIYTLSRHSEQITKTLPANPEPSSTPCVTLNLDRSELSSSGIWSVEVEFQNNGWYGIAKTTMEIN